MQQKFTFLTLLCFLLLFSVYLNSQPIQSTSQDWVRMMEQPDANFFEIQKEFNDYFRNREQQKGDGYKAFKRWEYFWQSRIHEDGSFPNGSEIMTALKQKMREKELRKKTKSNRIQTPNANFSLIGPSNAVPTNGGAGRLCTIAFHPTNSNIMWVGSPAGGVWKTTNNGANWSSNSDQFATLGVGAIAIDPVNPNTMYLGTGDRDAGDTYGVGILKTTDGGANWSTTGLSYTVQNGRAVTRILVHPSQTNILIAATTSGVYKSLDAGVSWSQKTTSSTKDMVFMPSNPNYIYATVGGSVFRSTNLGDNWSALSTGFSSSAVNRIALAVCQQNPRCVYALCSNNSGSTYYGLYRSLDSGNTWSQRSSTPNILGGASDGSDSRGQGWYDLCVAVNPNDSNDVFVGGINTWRSTNGGTNWTCKSMWYTGTSLPYVHADEHDLFYKPGTSELYVSSDGGLFKTTNAGTSWTDLSAGLQIMQFYKISHSASTLSKVLGGAQDNGSNFNNAGTWKQIYGGDGMDNAIDQSNDSVLYCSSQNGNFGRSTNNGTSFTTITPSGLGSTGAWVTPIMLDASNNVYLAYRSIYRSTNRGAAWTNIGSSVLSSNATTLEISSSNANHIVVGNSSLLYRTTNGGGTWNSIKGSLPSSISRVIIHPNGPDTLVAVMSNWTNGSKVYRSTDGGTTWTNISGSLPNIPVNCAKYENNAFSGLYIGTDIGIYYRNNTMSDWVSFDDGLPNVKVNDLEIYTASSKIRAATYGRGAWEGDLFNDGPRAVFSASRTTTCATDTLKFIDNSANGPTSRLWLMPGANPSSSTELNPIVSYASAGQYTVTLIVSNVYGSDTLVKTNYITVNALPNASFTASKTSACSGDSIVLRANSGLRSYRWSNGDTTQSIRFSTIGSYQIQLTVVDDKGCTNSSNVLSYTIFASPTTTMSGDSIFCIGDKGNYTISAATPGSTYRWFKPRTGILIGDSTSTQVSYVWNVVGRDTVRMRETNVRGCTVDREVVVGVNAIPTIGIVGPTEACQNNLTVFSSSAATSGSSVLWLNPLKGTIVGSNTNTGGVNVLWTGSGIDTVFVKITTAAGCTFTASQAVVVKPTPKPSISGAQNSCVSTENVYQTVDNVGSSYRWVLPSAASFVGDSTKSLVRVRWDKDCQDSIRVTESFANGCSREAAFGVVVDVLPSPVISGISAACVDNTTTYKVSATSGSRYRWSKPNLGVVVGDSLQSELIVSWLKDGLDTLYVEQTSLSGCKKESAYVVKVSSQLHPNVRSSTSSFSLCKGDSLVLLSADGYSKYRWTRNGVVVADAKTTLSVRSDGVYLLFVESGNCKGASDSVFVSYYAQTPTPQIAQSINVLTCDVVADKYFWFVDNVLIDDATTKSIVAKKSGNYCVKTMDANGCVSEMVCVSFIVSVPSSEELAFSVYLEPNPTESYFRIRFENSQAKQVQVRLLDESAKTILERGFPSLNECSLYRFDVETLPRGVYFVELDFDGVRRIVKKLIHY